jgi:hypothetical protein
MSAIDVESVRLAQMVEAAFGHADIPAALAAAGFTMSEITENAFEVAERLVGLETLEKWKREADRKWAEDMAKDDAENGIYG